MIKLGLFRAKIFKSPYFLKYSVMDSDPECPQRID